MKLYITGPVGSGKTTLARQFSQKTGVPCFHLDQVAHEPDPDRPGGNRKRPEEERDAMFRSILEQGDYILEDTGRACLHCRDGAGRPGCIAGAASPAAAETGGGPVAAAEPGPGGLHLPPHLCHAAQHVPLEPGV